MLMLVVSPETAHRRVEDCPRWMEVGSAENCEIDGATGFTIGGGGGGGGGAGGAGAFFLHPAANSASRMANHIKLIFRLLNMNYAS
jgi:hypothetical protein